MRENYNGEGNLSFPKGDPLAAKITPPIDLHGESLNAYISESTHPILKLKPGSSSAREELSNDPKNDALAAIFTSVGVPVFYIFEQFVSNDS